MDERDDSEVSDDFRERATTAVSAADTGAAVAFDAFRSPQDVDTKTDPTDYVTETDRITQRRVIGIVRESFPDDPIVAEEAAPGTVDSVPEMGPAWLIDPIDGTNNYIRRVPLWATSVGALVDGQAVAGATVMPALSDTYRVAGEEALWNGEPMHVSNCADPRTAVVVPLAKWSNSRQDEFGMLCQSMLSRFVDVRRFLCAQATLAMVAAGSFEGAVTNVTTHPWDVVVGVQLIRAAGGTVTNVDGKPWRIGSKGLVASNGESIIHKRLMEAADDANAIEE
jgi:myo-inositol-1(or 4)-monophosphatase